MRKYSGSISINDYKKAIETMTSNQKKILVQLYQNGPFDDANEIAEVLGYKNYGAANLHIENLGKSITKSLSIDINTLPKYNYSNSDNRPSYYLLVHNVLDEKWTLDKNLQVAIETILPVNIIFQLPEFTVCKASNDNSPIQILLKADSAQYTVFTTEMGGRIMTAQNKSVSKKAKVAILENPIGRPDNLSDCHYQEYEVIKTEAISLLYKRRDENKLSLQALSVLENIEEANRRKENLSNILTYTTPDEQEQEEITSYILQSEKSKKDIYHELINQKEKEDEIVIINRKEYKRDNVAIARIKHLWDYKCQLCGTTILKHDKSFYIEAAHIRAKYTGGKETVDNILILCPNHHKEFDFGNLEILKKDKLCVDFLLNGNKYKVSFSFKE